MWTTVGVLVGVAIYAVVLLGSFVSQAEEGVSVRSANLGFVGLTYVVFAALVTPLLAVIGGVLTIWRAIRPFAFGLLAGAGVGLVGVSTLAVVLTPPLFG